MALPPVPAAPQPTVPRPHCWHPCSLAASPWFALRWHSHFLSALSPAAGLSVSWTQDPVPLGGAHAQPQSSCCHPRLLAGTSRPFSHCGSFAPLWVKSCQAWGCTGGVGAELETGLRELGELGLEQEPGGRLCGQDSMWCSAGALPAQPVGSGLQEASARRTVVLVGAGRSRERFAVPGGLSAGVSALLARRSGSRQGSIHSPSGIPAHAVTVKASRAQ